MSSSQYIEENLDNIAERIGLDFKKILPLLNNILVEFVDKGQLTPDTIKLASLDSKILEAIQLSGYGASVDSLLESMMELQGINEKFYQKAEKLSVYDAIQDSERLNNHVKNIIESLKGQGASENILKPIENLIRQQILLRRPYTETVDLLRIELSEESTISRYVKQIATDGLSQYDGIINDEVRVKYGLDKFYYIGSLIETSRPICDHIRDNFKGIIYISDLEKVLDEFCPNGIPSNEKITFITVNEEKRTMKKGSGMIKGTNSANFSTYRGGYGCRHEVKWTRASK